MSEIDPEKLGEALKIVGVYAGGHGPADFRAAERTVVEAARRYLSTLPRVKEVEVWRVEGAVSTPDGWVPFGGVYRSPAEAETVAREHRLCGAECIDITGPHKQRVPA